MAGEERQTLRMPAQVDDRAVDPQLEGDYNPAGQPRDRETGQFAAAPQWSDDEEQRARQHGWRPLEEFTGDASNWRDPKAFLAYMDDNPKVLTERLGRMERLMQQQADDNARRLARAEMAAYERAKADIAREISQAAAAGDQRRVTSLTEELTALQKPQPPQQPSTSELPAFKEFEAKAKWYNEDASLTAYANETLAPQLRRMGYDDTSSEFFAAVDKGVRAAFPHMFSNPRRDQPSPVNGGGTRRPGGPPSAATLSPEARTQAEKDVKRGLYKSVDAWAEVFYSQQGVN